MTDTGGNNDLCGRLVMNALSRIRSPGNETVFLGDGLYRLEIVAVETGGIGLSRVSM